MKFAKMPPMHVRDWCSVNIAAKRCGVAARDIFAAIDKKKLKSIRVSVGSQVCEYVLLHQCREHFEKALR